MAKAPEVSMSLLLALVLSPFQPPEVPTFRPPRTLAEVIDRGVVLPDHTLSEEQISLELKRYCQGGEAVACLLAQRRGDLDLPEIEAHCTDGDVDACVVQAWWVGLQGRVDEEKLARACTHGGPAACLVGVRARVRRGQSPEFARVYAEDACRVGLAAGCVLRAELELDVRVRAAQLSASCTDGDARGCLRLWVLARGEGLDADAAAHAAARGCGLGVARLCEPAIEAWAPGTARGVVKRLRRQACALGQRRHCEGAMEEGAWRPSR
jgi:hypothetical protein